MVPCRSPPALPALPREVHDKHGYGVPLPSESFSGEDSQRWTPAGDKPPEGKSTVHYFYSCCGASDVNAPGCVVGRHLGFGEEDDWGRKPDDRPPSP